MTSPSPATRAGRQAARMRAVQALYEIEAAGSPLEDVLADFHARRLETLEDDADDRATPGRPLSAPADPALFTRIVGGAHGRAEDVDRLLEGSLARGYSMERLERVLRAILRAGAWELMMQHDNKAGTIISDYVDIAHGFYDGREPGLVNAVLDRVARVLRPDEVRGTDGKPAPEPDDDEDEDEEDGDAAPAMR